MKKWFIVLLGIILASIIIYLIEEVEDSEINEICFEENCFSVEISDTPEKRARGLMFREIYVMIVGCCLFMMKKLILNFG